MAAFHLGLELGFYWALLTVRCCLKWSSSCRERTLRKEALYWAGFKAAASQQLTDWNIYNQVIFSCEYFCLFIFGRMFHRVQNYDLEPFNYRAFETVVSVFSCLYVCSHSRSWQEWGVVTVSCQTTTRS